jgi:cation diffusion facilitator family transporter
MAAPRPPKGSGDRCEIVSGAPMPGFRRLGDAGLGVYARAMTDCGCEPLLPETRDQRRDLWIVLVLNAAMFAIETGVGLAAHSAGLIADGLDMLSDASVYAIALVAIGRSARFKAEAARWSGWMLLLLGGGLLAEVVRRFFTGGAPEGGWMIGVALLALAVNLAALRILAQHRRGEVHLRAAWIFTRMDVVANVAVLASGALVLATGNRYFDLVVGAAISVYVVREALEILREAHAARAAG